MTECFKSLKVHLNIERIWLEPINVQLSYKCSPVWLCRWINCRETVFVMVWVHAPRIMLQEIMNKRQY